MTKPANKKTLGRLRDVLGSAHGGDQDLFCVPDLRGRFLRGVDHPDPAKARDPGSYVRSAPRSDKIEQGNPGNAVGSVQADVVGQHKHTVQLLGFGGGSNAKHRYFDENELNADVGLRPETDLGSPTGLDSHPDNLLVNFFIKL